MSLTALPTRTTGRLLADADDLVDVLGVPFSDEQVAAITAPLAPGVIIAGAGSGKTTVMAARVVWLVGTGQVRPEEVLGLTFTRKAAGELSGRVRAALVRAGVIDTAGVDEAGEQVIMTYDAFAARLVSEHGLRIGVESDPVMITGATRYRLAARVVSAAAGPFESVSRLRPASVTERVLRLDAELSQHLVGQAELDHQARDFGAALQHAPTNTRGNTYAEVKRAAIAVTERLELASLVADYAALKRRLGVVEFADQMAVAARLAREVPHVSQSLRERFRVVLLDEYQDTSAAQALMLQGLFSGPGADVGRGHPVTAVGDPFQAIYGWRGAAASNILQFARDFPRADGARADRFSLTVNRRSGHAILAAANRLSAPLRDAVNRAGSGSDGSAGQLLRAPDAATPGAVEVASFTTWPDEVGWIADRVAALGPSHPRGSARGRGQRTTNPPGSRPERAWSDFAILTRRNADIGPLYAELTARDIPVEIVGLGGLLTLPEIADVVATLRVLHDVTANPDLIRLLTGPRWAIGPRDLALLGRRAAELAMTGEHRDATARPDGLMEALSEAVAQVDPSEMTCLVDAVADPGELDYSAAARHRLARFAGELASLRSHSHEPVLDLTRRVIGMLGLDIELIAAGSSSGTTGGGRDQLAAFVDAVAEYVDVDGDASLGGLLAWLQAEIDQGTGLDQAVPSDRDAVKLLTVHRAKGLEWDVVFLPALTKGTFPSDRVTDDWVTNPAVLPAELRGDAGSIPQLADATAEAMKTYHAALAVEQLQAENRLAYVGATRAKRLLIGSGHYWRPELTRAKELSPYLGTLWRQAERLDEARDQAGRLEAHDKAGRSGGVLAEAPPPGPDNPLVAEAAPQQWPRPLDPDGLARRREAAALVQSARHRAAATGSYDVANPEPLLLDSEQVVAGWDAEESRLLAEARRARRRVRNVPVPPVLSATQLIRAQAAPAAFAAELARPMPRKPSGTALLGGQFHHWLEHFYEVGQLFDPDDLPDRADGDLLAGEDLYTLCKAFEAGRFASSVPIAIEAPFELLIGGRVLRGRIDAVFDATGLPAAATAEPAADVVVVDWKTGSVGHADPLQLAIYRVAWSRVHQIPLDRVAAGFYWVRSDRFESVTDLPDEAGIERLLDDLGSERN